MTPWKYPDLGELPENGRYVLCQRHGTNWHSKLDQAGVNYVVCQFKKGRTAQEVEASGVWQSCDEGFNNQRPYCWDTFGPSRFFGQEIVRWMEIPRD